jgi:UTP--glucose-1-phosphate uridylyltransferase
MEKKKVTKAVIAAAGLGTRFLPQTKAMPKEMLPIMGKPIIQWVVEELVDIGVSEIIIVTGAQKRALEDHFDRSIELEGDLRKKGKTAEADEIQAIAEMANFIYIRQKEPFFFVSADDLFVSPKKSRAKQMLEAYNKTGKSVIAGLEIDRKDSSKYGMLDLGEKESVGVFKLKGLIEKPEPKEAPSDFMTIMWYLLTPNVFEYVRGLKAGKGGELIAADALARMLKEDEVYARILDGTYHDCGNYVSYLKASLHFASQYDDVHADISKYVKDKILNK